MAGPTIGAVQMSDPDSYPKVVDRGRFVVPPSEREGVGVVREISSPTTTPSTLEFAAGLISIELTYLDLGSAVGDWIFVVFDALSDSDAATKLADSETRIRIMLGETGAREFHFSVDEPVRRIDVASNVASESGTSVVRVIGKAVV